MPGMKKHAPLSTMECGRSRTPLTACRQRGGAEHIVWPVCSNSLMSEPQILCELIADGHHVLPTLMKMLYRAKGAAGIALVTDATAGAGLPNESHFQLGGIDCVVKDGVCFLADGSALAGSATRMIDLVRTMLRSTGISLPEAIQMATAQSRPRARIGRKERLLENWRRCRLSPSSRRSLKSSGHTFLISAAAPAAIFKSALWKGRSLP